MIWYSTTNKRRTPYKRGRGWSSIIVAIEIDGNCLVAPGTCIFDKNGTPRYKGVGVNAEPYAWAYVPDAPPQSKVRP